MHLVLSGVSSESVQLTVLKGCVKSLIKYGTSPLLSICDLFIIVELKIRCLKLLTHKTSAMCGVILLF